jgi:Tfp pilus assembly protein PilN
MRPVNLIPEEERRGNRRPMRGGPLAYIVLGALVAALLGVVLLVVADNQISSRTSEISELKRQTAAAEAQATRLAAYTEFHEVSSQRTLTVSNLANSRFDWEKVMRELALVLPGDVTLTNLTGTVRPGISVGGGEEVSLRSSIAGPALSMAGCAPGQEAVARFVTALKDIDGVTRVGLQSSQLPTSSESGGSVPASGGCSSSSAQFQLVVAFDAAPISAAPTGETEVAVAPAPEEASSEEAPAESSTTSSEGE